jgi:hypothetical protein
MNNCLGFVAAVLRLAAVHTALLCHDAPLYRARHGTNRRTATCRAVAPRFAFDVRLDPRLRARPQYVVVPVELLPSGSVLELDAFSPCEAHTSLMRAIRRAICLSDSADLARFDDTAFLAT